MMTRVFVDTPAFIAVLNADDRFHPAAREAWARALGEGHELYTTSHVLVETTALLQARFGMDAVRAFNSTILPLLAVQWVTGELHGAAVTLLLALGQKDISLVDCASFVTMRTQGIALAFTFDPHFEEQGFGAF